MKSKKVEINSLKVEDFKKMKKDEILSDILNKINKNEKKSIKILNIVINLAISIFLLFLAYCVINNYTPKYEIFFYLTLWSFFMNLFYIITVTVIDLIKLVKNDLYFKYCLCFNNFMRNSYLRICFPFSISIVFLYWMLILLGDDFQYASRDLWDNCISFSFHGLIFIFLLYDTFSYPHINLKNRKIFDFLIISGIIVIYFIIIGVSKYALHYDVYDFMIMSNTRQIAAAGFLIYMGIMDGYVVFVLISNRFFIEEGQK